MRPGALPGETKEFDMNHGTVIYAVISVTFSALASVFAWATYTAPLHLTPVPFLGTMMFCAFAAASGWAAVHCAGLKV